MQEKGSIDPNKLDFSPYLTTDDFSNLNFKQRDGSDLLNVDAYIHGNPINYIQHHVSTIYSVRYENNLIGYFTLSMSSIGRKDVLDNDTFSVPFPDYPALLLGQMGIDINFRGNKIGQRICSFCSGMGQELDKKTACAFLILRTTAQLAKGYYEPECRFKWKPKNEGKVWMYRKLFDLNA